MRITSAWGVILGFLCLPVFAAPPTASDVTVVTFRDTPVQVVLSAADPDICEIDPHPLVFAIVEPPQRGTLNGNLAAVSYDCATKTGSVALTYTPSRGFVGTDTFIYSVTDPFGFFSLAVVRVEVVRPPAPPPSLRGSTDLRLTLKETGVTDVANTLNLTYIVEYIELGLDTSWSLTGGWTSLALKALFPVVDNTKITSTLALNPAGPSFSYWQMNTTFSLAGFNCTHTLYFSPSSSYTKLTASGRVDALSLSTALTFNLPVLEFSEWTVSASFADPCCGFRVNSDFRFVKAGLDSLTLEVRRIPLPEVFCPILPLYLNLKVRFTTTLKEVTPGFELDARWPCCVSLRVEPVVEDTAILGIYVYALDFRMTLPGGMSLWIGTSLDPDRDSGVTGYAEYFEVWHLTGPLPSCCGPVGRWNLFTYFKRNGTLLGWGALRVDLTFWLAKTIRASLYGFMPHTGAWELRFGLNLTF